MASSSQVAATGDDSHLGLLIAETDTPVDTSTKAGFHEFLKGIALETSDNARLLRVLGGKTPEEHLQYARGFRDLFLSEGDTRFLECAVATCEHALDALPQNTDYNDAQRFERLSLVLANQGMLAATLVAKEKYDDAIDVYERAVKATPDSHPLTATLCIGLGVALKCRFDQFSKEEDLHQAICTLGRGVACFSADSPLQEKEVTLRLLSELLEVRWRLTNDQRDLDHLVACAKSLVTSNPSSLDNHIWLGRALLKMADASTGQDTAYLLEFLQSSTIPLEDLANTETALAALFQSNHDMRTLDHIVVTCEYAIERCPDHDSRKFDHFFRLGHALEERGLQDDAIYAYERAVDVASDLTPLTGRCFTRLGLLLYDRFGQSQDIKDLDKATWAMEMAIGCTPENEQALHRWALSLLLQTWWDLSKDVDDLERPDSGNRSRLDLPTLRADTLANTPGIADFVEFLKHQALANPDVVWLWKALEGYPPEKHQAWEMVFMELFCREGDTRFLECAVATCEHALDALPKNTDHDAQRFEHLSCMLTCQGALAARLEEKEMHDDAIDVYERAVKAAPDSYPLIAKLCIGLARAVQRRFNQLSKGEDLDQAISTAERAVACTSADNSLRDQEEESLRLLSELLGDRWGSTKDQGDLDLLVGCATQVVTLDPSDLRNHDCLGRALLKMADASTGQDTAYFSDLLQFSTIPLENLAELEIALLSLFNSEHDMRSLVHVVATCEHAIERYPDHDPRKFDHFYHLGKAFEMRGLYDKAIDAYESAVDFAPDAPDLTSTGACFGLLGSRLGDRFDRSRDVKDLDKSIWALDMAIGCIPEGESLQGIYHGALSDLLQERWQLFKNVDDLERMVACSETEVALNPTNPETLVNNGIKVRLAFEYHRTLSLIDLSIRTIQKALLYVPRTSAAHARALCHLGYSYCLRFQYLNCNLSDGLSCVSCLDEAETMQKLDMQFLLIRTHVITSVGYRLSDVQYITKAASTWETLLNQELVQGSERLEALLDLAKAKLFIYETKNVGMNLATKKKVGVTLELEQAIQVAKDAIDAAASLGSSAQARAYSLLGKLLYIQLLIESPRPDLFFDCPEPVSEPVVTQVEYILSVTKRTVSLTPEGSERYFWAMLQHATGKYLRGQYFSSNKDQRESALESMSMSRQLAFEAGDKSPLVRTEALRLWALIADDLKDWESSMQAYHMLLSNIEDLVWLGFSTTQQMELLSQQDLGSWITHLSSRSAHAAVCKGSIATALEWLDQCRSIAWQKILNLRVSSALLEHVAPDLASKLQTVAQTLQDGAFEDLTLDIGDIAGEAGRQRRHRSAEDWNHLINEVRSLPGFESFLRPKTADQLSSLNFDGYVVALSLCHNPNYGCDAFILRGGSTDIRLCQLDPARINSVIATSLYQKLQRAMKCYSSSRGDESRASVPYHRQTSSKIMAGLLSDLWSGLVKPILDFIHLEPHNEGSTPPRLWWCPNSTLAHLPLHAAGLYDTSDRGTKIYEYVASSYTPTLSMLADKLDCQHPAEFKGLLAVSQPSGDPPIPKTVEEVESVVAIARHHDPAMEILRLNDVDATAERILNGMATSSWIHLACHASQNLTNPLDSAFLLSDRPLKLSEIAARALPHVDLAFLSACQTATGDAKATDEAVHLAAGMLVVGFRSVVATMWSVRDSDAPIVADAFYQELFSGGKVDVGMSGIALHHATMALRERIGVEEFMSWVPFVHFGV